MAFGNLSGMASGIGAGNPYSNAARGAIGQAQGAGLYDPTGSPAIRAALERRALRQQRNQRRRGQVSAQLAGLDPYGQRQAMVDTERQAGSDLSNNLADANLQYDIGNQDWARSLLTGGLDFERQQMLERQRAKAERDAHGGIGGAIGGLVGAAVPWGLDRLFPAGGRQRSNAPGGGSYTP